MNKIELIPAIDIIDGKCVRLSKGDYNTRKVYAENPVDVAMAYEDHGIRRLHVVDLDGAASRHIVNYRTLDLIASRTSLIIDFGGGIKTDEDLVIAFDNGAEMVTLGSVAVKEPQLMQRWIEKYGQERIILGADVRDGRISTNGWKEDSPLELMPFLKDYTAKGITKVLCTDISRDGMLQGPAIDLYRQVMAEFPGMHLIASGGVSGIQDLEALQEAGIPAVVIGKAIYEGRISLQDLSRLL
jgi:phosphoribosylformimino-5-aminoimidazole carboxamide ribotide isomerase